MAMDIEQVRWVSHLARLRLADDELTIMARQLGKILDHVDQLQAVDTDAVEPLAHPLPLANVFRPDEPVPSLPVTDALGNAPARLGDHFGVPAILD